MGRRGGGGGEDFPVLKKSVAGDNTIESLHSGKNWCNLKIFDLCGNQRLRGTVDDPFHLLTSYY